MAETGLDSERFIFRQDGVLASFRMGNSISIVAYEVQGEMQQGQPNDTRDREDDGDMAERGA